MFKSLLLSEDYGEEWLKMKHLIGRPITVSFFFSLSIKRKRVAVADRLRELFNNVVIYSSHK